MDQEINIKLDIKFECKNYDLPNTKEILHKKENFH